VASVQFHFASASVARSASGSDQAEFHGQTPFGLIAARIVYYFQSIGYNGNEICDTRERPTQ